MERLKQKARMELYDNVESVQQYQPDLFVGRRDIIEHLGKKIQTLQTPGVRSDESVKPLVEIYGLPGLGKTWLIQHLAHELSPQETAPLVAQVDFADLTQKPLYFHYYAVLKILASQLLEKSGSSFKIPYLDFDGVPTPKQLDKMAKGFVSFIKTLGEYRFVPVLAFDTTNLAEEIVLEWLEEKIIFPLIQDEQTLFVFAGDSRLFWKYFEVKRRVDPIPLSSLDEDDSAEQLENLNVDYDLAYEINKVTFGHPRANEFLAHHPSVNSDFLQAVADLRDTYINRIIEIDTPFEDSVGLVWDMIALRRFHTDPLRQMWAKIRNDQNFSKKAEGDYLDFIQVLIDKHITSWDQEQGGYVLDHSLHQLMKGVLKTLNPQKLADQHQAAMKMYEKYTRELPEHSEHYLTEWLYHALELTEAPGYDPDPLIDSFIQIVLSTPNPSGTIQSYLDYVEQHSDDIGFSYSYSGRLRLALMFEKNKLDQSPLTQTL